MGHMNIYISCKRASTNRRILLRIERAPSASTYSRAAFSSTPSKLTEGITVVRDKASLCRRAERHFDEMARRSSGEKGTNGMTVDTRATNEACERFSKRTYELHGLLLPAPP